MNYDRLCLLANIDKKLNFLDRVRDITKRLKITRGVLTIELVAEIESLFRRVSAVAEDYENPQREGISRENQTGGKQ